MTTPRKPFTIDLVALARAQEEFERITREEQDGTRTPEYPDDPPYVPLPQNPGDVVSQLVPRVPLLTIRLEQTRRKRR